MKLELEDHIGLINDGANGIGAAITCEMAGAFALSVRTSDSLPRRIQTLAHPNCE